MMMSVEGCTSETAHIGGPFPALADGTTIAIDADNK